MKTILKITALSFFLIIITIAMLTALTPSPTEQSDDNIQSDVGEMIETTIENLPPSRKNRLTLIFPSKDDPSKLLTVIIVSESFPPNIINCISKQQPTHNNIFPEGTIRCLIMGEIIYKNGKPIGHKTFFKQMELASNQTNT